MCVRGRNTMWIPNTHELFPEDRPYVAAKFLGQDIPYIFNLGDNKTSYGYLNRQLLKGKRYRIFLRAHVYMITKLVPMFKTSGMSSFLSLDMSPIPPGPIPSKPPITTYVHQTITSEREVPKYFTDLQPAGNGRWTWVVVPVILALSSRKWLVKEKTRFAKKLVHLLRLMDLLFRIFSPVIIKMKFFHKGKVEKTLPLASQQG
ncbi:unnamed protein product [Darwinula stevensoni]|uniref:Uncharacterized protein n=1 Tax=Darwinula stevensoni TaxID=69355 RepID=A0A7R8XBX1_9CRUS|nr:unnamed protein product [Darwinula stevensoni]CAG0893209.1 unnamed protein product [Darwinula stevensoni]